MLQSTSLSSSRASNSAESRSFSKKLRLAKRECGHRLTKMERLIADGQLRDARKLANIHLRNFQSRLVALCAQNLECPPHLRIPTERLCQEARALYLSQPCEENVLVKREAKSSGGYRLICSFGPRNRARQALVAEVIKLFIIPQLQECQFALDGGRDACVLAIKREAEARKNQYAAETDITGFFGHIDTDQLKGEIGLPSRVIDTVIRGDTYHYVYEYGVGVSEHAKMANECRKGIPQGSLVSPYIAEYVVARTLSEVKTSPAGVYVDNMFSIAETQEDLLQQTEALREAFSQSLYGPFFLTDCSSAPLSEGIDCLGYTIQQDRDGEVWIEASDRAYTKRFDRLVTTAKALKGLKPAVAVQDIMDKQIKAWRLGYNLACSNVAGRQLAQAAIYLTKTTRLKGDSGGEIHERFKRWLARNRRASAYLGPIWL